MPITVQQLGDDPIVLVTMEGSIAVQDIAKMYAQTAAIADKFARNTYRIMDVDKAEITFDQLIKVVKNVGAGAPGSLGDPRIKAMFVGQNSMARLASDMLSQQQFGGLELPIFPGLGEALLWVNEQIAKEDGHWSDES